MYKNYRKAIRYATKISSYENALDIVHDAYLRWYNNTNNNLFEEENEVVINKVRQEWWNRYLKPQYTTFRSKEKKVFSNLEDLYSFYSVNGVDVPIELQTTNSPEKLYIAKEQYQLLRSNLNKFDRKTFDLWVQGYLKQEIEKEQNRSNVTITASVKKIKEEYNKISIID